ncbi:MAG: hypothetical protein ACRD0P_16980 [Stackebrandtia sp.]
MSAKPAWLRGLAAVVAWGGVTAVAAAGSWLGMSTVLTGQPSTAAAATVVAPSGDSTPSGESSTTPRGRSQPSAETSPRKERNGWTQVGVGTYERAFVTGGGSAVIQLRYSEAVFVSASPAEGFTARKEWPAPDRLVVSFHSSGSMVTIDTLWRDGEPYAQVSET